MLVMDPAPPSRTTPPRLQTTGGKVGKQNTPPRTITIAKHRHTQSLGLLSPIPSFASLASPSLRPSSPLRPSTPLRSATPRTRPGTPQHTHRPQSPRTPRLPGTPRIPVTPRSVTTPTTPTTPRLLHLRLLLSPVPTPSISSPETMPALSMPTPIHCPAPTFPSASTKTSKSPVRSQSRSERLLRDTLRRDEMALRSPPPPVPQTPKKERERGHKRRHSHVPLTEHSQLDGVFFTPVGQGWYSPPPPPARRSSPTASRGVSPLSRRTPSPSPTSSRGRLHRSPASEMLVPSLSRRDDELTPHEQVLRARLERVLASPLQKRTRSKTEPAPSAAPVPVPRRADTSPGRRRTPPSSASASGSASQSVSEEEEEHEHLLTPPPTPPSFPSRAQKHLPPRLPSHLQQTDRPFNARQASLHCRQIEGYVSFAAVEGLGVPPDAPEEEEGEREQRGRSTGGVWDWTRRLVGGSGEER